VEWGSIISTLATVPGEVKVKVRNK